MPKWMRNVGLVVIGVLAGVGAVVGQVLTDAFMLAASNDESEKGGKEEEDAE